jgi:hypothetical protein
MKHETISFKIERPKQRVHRMLFENDSPYKYRVVNPKKTQYNRRPKHRKNSDSWED